MKRTTIYALALLAAGVVPAVGQTASGRAAGQGEGRQPVAGVMKYTTRHIQGKVVNGTTRRPVSGAMVRVAEMEGHSALTHADGSYELDVPTFANALEVSAPGMNSTRIGLAAGAPQRTATLYPENYSSDYADGTNLLGTQSAGGFGMSNELTVEGDVQKRLGAEVRTTMRNGTPGVGGVMFIDGLHSINANSQPLIVVDGVVFDMQYGRTMLHQGFYNDILANISPADIEKVTVLRNGTALYGAKGSNGVILIQTRRNHSMATRITASLSGGVTLEPKYLDMMDAAQFKSYASDLLGTTSTLVSSFKFLNEDPTYYYYPQYHNNTDWKDQLYRTAFTQNYGINVEGGDEVASYNLSLGYVNYQSTLKYNGMNRVNIRFNTDIALTKKFSVRFDASFANQVRNLRNDGAPENYTDGTPTSPSFLGYAKSPMLSPYAYANGKVSSNFLDIGQESYLDEALSGYDNYNYKLANPIAINVYGESENKNHFENSMVNLTITPKYQLGRGRSLSEHFSYNLVNTNEKYYIPINGVPNYYVSAVGDYRENEARSLVSKQNSVFSDTRLDWTHLYGAHDVRVMGGARINWEAYTLNTQLGYNTGNDKTPFISSSLLNAKTSGTNDNWSNWAWYAQAEYNYLQRYYLQGNLTAETSSRFGKDADNSVKIFGAPWAFFWGLQGAWVVTNEPWMARVKWLDYLKLSTGYDVTGNDDIDYYAARSYFRARQFLQSVASLSFDNIGNTNLQWETTGRWNAGLQASFLADRLGLRFNYYVSHTNHLLGYQNLNYLTGLKQNWGNGGKLKNQGFDITLSGKLIATRNFMWELGASMGHYKNKVTSLPGGVDSYDTSLYGGTVRTQVAQPVGVFYGYRTLGVFATSEEAKAAGLYVLGDNGVDKHYYGAGDMHFYDRNGDHQITDDDRVIIGDPNPDVYGNIFTSVAYKQLRLDVNFNYSCGNDVYNYMRSQLEGGSRFMNQTLAMTQRWQTEGQNTSVPRASFQDPMGNSRFSDRWIEDGSYLKLKTVTLSYNLPMHVSFLQGFVFWLQGNNLLTFTKYLGPDPEFAVSSSVLGQGIDAGRLPLSRSIVAGVKIKL